MNDNQTAIIDAAQRELERLDAPKLWMTARGLAARLRHHERWRLISQSMLYDVLADHAEHARPRRIRNSKTPSAKTLEVLWGAVSKVGDMDVEPPRKRADSYDQQTADLYQREMAVAAGERVAEIDDAPDFFLSYNFDDSEQAARVTETLEAKHYSVWMAGACIAADAIINDEVRDAMRNAGGMLLYLSSSSLRSLWVAKEQIVGDALPRHVIVKGDDPDLLGLVHHWIEGGDDQQRLADFGGLLQVDAVSYNVAATFRSKLRSHVVDSALPIYMDPWVDGCHPRIVPLSAFPDAPA